MGARAPQGKGITDQDRNILSNQILILGFLRSAAKHLVRGPTPQLQSSRKRKRKRPSSDDDEWTDGDDDQAIDGRARGTILITLRNVPPYTEWSVCVTLLPLVVSLTSHRAGTCQN
jgi:25S rRNA (uracil2634-N3)-methyltransferase